MIKYFNYSTTGLVWLHFGLITHLLGLPYCLSLLLVGLIGLYSLTSFIDWHVVLLMLSFVLYYATTLQLIGWRTLSRML